MARQMRRQMGMRLRVEGVNDVIQALQEADEAIKKELNDLIAEAAEIVFREADSRVPIGETGNTRNSLRIEIGKNKKGLFYANVVVGRGSGHDAFYVAFYELGTSRQPPRPFMRPSLDKSRAKIRKHLIEGLRAVIARQGR